MGAEVIKVESRRKLDNNRWHFKLGQAGSVNSGEFNFTNRGTKSITLNMRKPGAVKVFKELVKISDVIITNYTPRVMPGWGLDYDILKAVKTRIPSYYYQVLEAPARIRIMLLMGPLYRQQAG